MKLDSNNKNYTKIITDIGYCNVQKLSSPGPGWPYKSRVVVRRSPGNQIRGGDTNFPFTVVCFSREEVATSRFHSSVEWRDRITHGQSGSRTPRTTQSVTELSLILLIQ